MEVLTCLPLFLESFEHRSPRFKRGRFCCRPIFATIEEMKFIVGIDEVGRGSLAGPVVVAAVAVPTRRQVSSIKCQEGDKIIKIPLRDSKKLTPKRREKWFEYFKNNPAINYAIARVYPRQIEKRNITKAANLAALRAFRRLASRVTHHASNYKIYLDGGLYLGSKDEQIVGRGKQSVRTIVRGDEKIKAIAAASIVAKVWRDRVMTRLAKKYPVYGFEKHKGYGTKKHFAAIKKYGPSSIHRLTFLRK